jgi:uncharacterized protein YjiS (DUF1127 family)
MNGILEPAVLDPCLDAARLQARPMGDLWRMWMRVGYALAARAGNRTLGTMLGTIRLWARRSAQRSSDAYFLRQLTEHELRDMGVTRQQAMFEVNKPFWRA